MSTLWNSLYIASITKSKLSGVQARQAEEGRRRKRVFTVPYRMGNYRFRLSDMMPKDWLYKLIFLSKSRKQYSSQPLKKKPPSTNTTSRKSNVSQQRYSYYYASEPGKADKCCNSQENPESSDALFPDSPIKSPRKRSKRKTIYRPSPKLVSSPFSSDCSCHGALNSVWTELNPTYFTGNSSSSLESSSEPHFHEFQLSRSEEDDGIVVHGTFDQVASLSSCGNCKVGTSTNDIAIDVNDEFYQKADEFGVISETRLPRMSTMPADYNHRITEVSKLRRSSSKLEETRARSSVSVEIVNKASIRNHKEQDNNHPARNFSAKSNGIRLRSNPPKISSTKIRAYARKSVSLSRNETLSNSLAVVKYSVDPQRDFQESMMEMIAENNMQSSKDFEDLLACYLSLNSNEYHDLIVKAFEQIWFYTIDLRL